MWLQRHSGWSRILMKTLSKLKNKQQMRAVTIKGTTPEEIASALADSKAGGFAPTLAITFLSIKQDRTAICKLLENSGLQIFGLTTAGEFLDGEIGEESTVIMLLDMNRD